MNGDGVPVCKLGLRMKPDGVESNRNRYKWRCPKANKWGCDYKNPCSNSPYEPVIHTAQHTTHRRTFVERSNKREKEYYKLEDGRHRSSMMW